jgi:phosphoribosylaminoimidazole-succinocarboxamide synthase
MMTSLMRQGKVRDIYDLGDRLLIVASDRISAFDWVLPTEIPDKGRVLTQLSLFWFDYLDVPNHVIEVDLRQVDLPAAVDAADLVDRAMIVHKCEVVAFECVVRGYLAGSGWADYKKSGAVCGIELPPGLVNSQRLSEPIFTPATKATSGHDENVAFSVMADAIGEDVAKFLRDRSIEVYLQAERYAAQRGIIVADTKFEWGWHNGELLLIDEVLTPDSSRFWPADLYKPGQNQPSFDKQFVRDWLEGTDWDKSSEPPPLPADIVNRTRQKYIEALSRLTGKTFAWM